MRDSGDRYAVSRCQCKSGWHLRIPDRYVSCNGTFFLIFYHHSILYLFSYLPLIMVCCFLYPELPCIYINFCIIGSFFCIGSLHRCCIYTFMSISLILCNTMKNDRHRYTVWQIRTVKRKSILIRIQSGFYLPCFVCLSCFLIRHRIIDLLLYPQYFHTVSSACQYQSLRQTDICYIYILRNCSCRHIIYYNPVGNLLSGLPLIFVCSFINFKSWAVWPYFCHIFA